MHTDDLAEFKHDHIFDRDRHLAERSTRAVMWITVVMMIVEIAAGWWFNSMALLADGWHMSSHAIAIGLSTFAYVATRRYARDPRFAFGAWKIEILSGFASAMMLLGIAIVMIFDSIGRLISPQAIHYQEAIFIAALGLLVNIVCAVILGKAHHHGHHDHDHDHGQNQHAHHPRNSHHHDLNLQSAYVHVIADAATSVLAMIALAGGWLLGWSWLDPTIGILGAALIALWAKRLIVDTGKILLDREMDHPIVAEIRQTLDTLSKQHNLQIADLHVWRVGGHAFACVVSVVTNDSGLTPKSVRECFAQHKEIVHSTIEINRR